MEFYLHIDGEQKGPYEVTELLEHGMKADTPVWRNGMADWAEARTVTDIAWMVKPIEAPKPPVYNTESAPPAYIPQQEPVQHHYTYDEEVPPCRSGLAIAIICLCSPLIALAFGYLIFGVMFRYCSYSAGEISGVMWLISSIIITILGIISLVFAINSKVAYGRKQYEVSRSRGNVARTLGWIGVGIMILVVVVMFLLGATSHRSYYLY